MKFGQLIEHNVKNIFVEKSYRKCGGEKLFSDSFLKMNIEHISESIVLKFSEVVVSSFKDYQNIVKPSCKLVTFALYVFLKTYRGLQLISQPHFLHDF